MSEYREGDTPEAKVPVDGEDVNEAFSRKAGEKGEAKVITACLVMTMSDGTCRVVTQIDSLEMEHQATPHEVFRMCADIQDQISGVRIIGEVLNHVNDIVGVGSRATVKGIVQVFQSAGLLPKTPAPQQQQQQQPPFAPHPRQAPPAPVQPKGEE